MQRLVLAILFVSVAVAAIWAATAGLRRSWRAVDGAVHERGEGGSTVQKLAFFLLVALILYVSLLGAA